MRGRGNMIVRKGNVVGVEARRGRGDMMRGGREMIGGVEEGGIWVIEVGEIEIDMMIGIHVGGRVGMIIIVLDSC
jgi:hypothetical protein